MSIYELQERTKAIKAMNFLINSLMDEDAYMRWISIVPDEVTDEDLEFIASDEENDLFKDATLLFIKLMKEYGDSGLFFGNTYIYEE